MATVAAVVNARFGVGGPQTRWYWPAQRRRGFPQILWSAPVSLDAHRL